jgi:uracil-DNA glycosylase
MSETDYRSLMSRLTGDSWGDILSQTVPADVFDNIGKELNEERTKYKVFPPKENIFNAFTSTPYDKVKVVILGLDPYTKEGEAIGRSFAVALGKKMPPSLNIIMDEIERSYDSLILLPDTTLQSWADQGVLLLNTALTVREKETNSHLKIWEPFTNGVINALNRRMNIIWILLGKTAQSYCSKITRDHIIHTAPHPAAEVYSGYKAGFIGSNIFINVNHSLSILGSEEIDWLSIKLK